MLGCKFEDLGFRFTWSQEFLHHGPPVTSGALQRDYFSKFESGCMQVSTFYPYTLLGGTLILSSQRDAIIPAAALRYENTPMM